MASKISTGLSYTVLVILCTISTISFLFFREQLLFYLYGYKYSILTDNVNTGFEAYKRNRSCKKDIFYDNNFNSVCYNGSIILYAKKTNGYRTLYANRHILC